MTSDGDKWALSCLVAVERRGEREREREREREQGAWRHGTQREGVKRSVVWSLGLFTSRCLVFSREELQADSGTRRPTYF